MNKVEIAGRCEALFKWRHYRGPYRLAKAARVNGITVYPDAADGYTDNGRSYIAERK